MRNLIVKDSTNEWFLAVEVLVGRIGLGILISLRIGKCSLVNAKCWFVFFELEYLEIRDIEYYFIITHYICHPGENVGFIFLFFVLMVDQFLETNFTANVTRLTRQISFISKLRNIKHYINQITDLWFHKKRRI